MRERELRIAELIQTALSDPRFTDSWRGTYMTQEFTDSDRKRVIKQVEKLHKTLRRISQKE